MEKSVEKIEPGSLSPLTLAFVGDAVFDLIIRTMVTTAGSAKPVKKLNREKADIVNAHSQAKMAQVLAPHLTEAETSMMRRGRNAHSSTVAKNQSVADYRAATGLEALFGYLYLSGQMGRILELIELGVYGNG